MKSLPSSPAYRRICADFREDQATEVDLLEVQIGIHRAARSKSEKDRILMETALFALRTVVDAYCGLKGDKYPDYQDVLDFLASGQLARLVCEPHYAPGEASVSPGVATDGSLLAASGTEEPDGTAQPAG